MKVLPHHLVFFPALSILALFSPRLLAQTTKAPIPGADRLDRDAAQPDRPTRSLDVIEGVEVKLTDRSIFYRRIAPLPPQPPRQPAPKPIRLTPQKMALAKARAAKKHEMLALSVTVYNRRVTEVRWSACGRDYRAFSNIDFNYLRGVVEIEAEDTVYTLLMGLGNRTTEESAAFKRSAGAHQSPLSVQAIPLPESFNRTRSEYRLTGAQAANLPTEGFAAMDALHSYFDLNRDRLVEDYTKKEAERIAREQSLREHPPVPKDTVIDFWPKKSTLYPTR